MANNKTKTASTAAARKAASSKSSRHKTLHQIFVDCLKDTYNAEQQLVEALPLMAKAAESEELQQAFEDHLKQTKKHVERLDKVFARLGEDSSGEPCKAMEGLIEEGKKIIREYEENAVRDSALIIGAQKIEHYEIAAYGSLCELADVLGYSKIHDILGKTLDEEETTDELLTEIAMDINDEAAELGNDDADETETT